MEIVSGAGHDACYVSRVAPTAMIFVPCEEGVSHNESESATPEDLAAGCNVLLYAMLERASACPIGMPSDLGNHTLVVPGLDPTAFTHLVRERPALATPPPPTPGPLTTHTRRLGKESRRTGRSRRWPNL